MAFVGAFSVRKNTDLGTWTLATISFKGYLPVQAGNAEHWRKLCEQAAVEQDSRKLMDLIVEIHRILFEEEQRTQAREAEPISAPQIKREKAA